METVDYGKWGVTRKLLPSTQQYLELLKEQLIRMMTFFHVELVLGDIFSLVPLVTDSRNQLAPA